MEQVIQFINSYVSKELTTLIVSILPLIELKGSILFARASGMDFLSSLLYSYIGSTLIFFPIFFLLVPVLNLLKKIKWFNKLALKIEGYFENKAKDVSEKRQGKGLSESGMKKLGVFLFVAIPLPMTGVWTGTAIAVFLGLKFKEAVLPISIGNLIAGIIISVLAELFYDYIDYILYGLLACVLIGIVVLVVKLSLSKPKQEEKGEE